MAGDGGDDMVELKAQPMKQIDDLGGILDRLTKSTELIYQCLELGRIEPQGRMAMQDGR